MGHYTIVREVRQSWLAPKLEYYYTEVVMSVDPTVCQNSVWETIIGLEVHAQLMTRSKMFCGCPSDYQASDPNTRVCPVCIAMPGSLPVINQQAVEFVIMTGLALNCSIAETTHFDRKNYPYPDLMKGYQISQYSNPIASTGWIELESSGIRRRVGITRAHLEEDVAKLQHVHNSSGESFSLLDVNRAGVPLMEVVGEPDIRSPEEAREYLIKMRSILQYLEVSSGDMEKGALRCDANISIRPKGSLEFMPKVEVKNMNSLRAVFGALEYEFQRQIEVVENGGIVAQETRGWVEDKGITVSQRSKEYAHDYRYFPEPDLPRLVILDTWVKSVSDKLPELPEPRKDRFISQYGLSSYDASLITTVKSTAEFFEETLKVHEHSVNGLPLRAKGIANWISGESARLVNQTGSDLVSSEMTPEKLSELMDLLDEGVIGSSQAKIVFEESFIHGDNPRSIVEKLGLAQVTNVDSMTPAIDKVLEENSQAVSDYLAGKETAIKFLIGQVMKDTKGKANPNLVSELLTSRLDSREL